jgi:endonuclease/exonuclease/phosphatase family metal-dependent hydrolase
MLSHLRRALLLALVAAAALPALSSAAGTANDPPRVMTRNLYLGASLNPALTAIGTCPFVTPAQCQAGILSANAAVWAQVQATDFPARAKLLAKEIDDSDPYLVGLQEVALWKTAPLTGGSETVAYDFLQSLQAELAARGLKYAVVSRQQEADLQAPAGAPYFVNAHLTMRDVILARTDLAPGRFSVSNDQHGNYATKISLTNPLGGTIDFLRGWTSVDVSIARKPAVRFVNTHLESFNTFVRQGQAAELVGAGGPLTTSIPAILVGDLNSDANIAPSADPTISDNGAFNIVAGAGFVDTPNTQNTCCYSADLLSGSFTERIDHIMSRPGLSGITTTVVGTDPSNRTPSGLWPTDHGGLVAGL